MPRGPTQSTIVGIVREPPEPQLPFSIHLEGGRGYLKIPEPQALGFLRLTDLTLEIPDIAFPIDLSGGAAQFRSTRCVAREMSLTVEAGDLSTFLGEYFGLAAQGFREFRLEAEEGGIRFAGSVVTPAGAVGFTLKAFARPEPGRGGVEPLAIYLHDLRTYGPLPFPAPFLAVRLFRPLEGSHLVLHHASLLTLDLHGLLLGTLLPAWGWAAPDLREFAVRTLDFLKGRIRVRSRSLEAPEDAALLGRGLDLDQAKFLENVGLHREAEELAAQEKFATAAKLLEARRAKDPKNPFALGRLLDLAAAPRAQALADEILSARPNDPQALSAVGALALRGEDWEGARGAYERLSALAEEEGSPDDLTYASVALGRALEHLDPPAARRAYERALGHLVRCEEALRGLARMCRVEGDWGKALESLAQLREVSEDHHTLADLWVEEAKIYEDPLQNPPEALERYQRAVDLEPDHAGAWAGIASTWLRAGEPVKAISVLTRVADRARERGDLDRSADLQVEIGKIWEERLGERSHAALRYRAALELVADHFGALERLANVQVQEQNWSGAVEAYERTIKLLLKAREKERAVTLLYTTARLWQSKLKDNRRAALRFQQILLLDAAYLPALEGLAKIYEESEAWEDLIGVYEQRCELLSGEGDPRSIAAIRFEIGRIWGERLSRPTEAVEAYRKALENDPTHEGAAGALAEILRGEGRWTDLVAHLEGRSALLGDDPLATPPLYEAGRIYEEELKEPERALDAYRRALRVDLSYTPAAEGLARVLDAQGRWAELAEALDILAQSLDDPLRMIEVYLSLGVLHEDKLQAPDEAIRAFRRVLELDPSHTAAHDRLAALLRGGERWGELADLLETRSWKSLPGEGVPLDLEAARLAAGPLGDPERAIRLLERVLAADPGHPEALERLSALFEATGRWGELVEVLERRAAVLPPAEGAPLLDRAAGALEASGGPAERSLDLRSRAASAAPDQVGIVSRWAEALDRAGRRDEFVEAAVRWARLEPDSEKSAAVFRRAARGAEQSGHPDRAVALLEEVLAVRPADEEAQAARVSLLRAGGRWGDLAPALEDWVDRTDDPARKRSLRIEAAVLWLDRLDRRDRAEGLLLGVLSEAPDQAEALSLYSRLLKEAGRWREWAQWTETRSERAVGEERRRLRLDAAEAWVDRGGDPQRAGAVLERYREEAAGDPEALALAAALARARSLWLPLALLLEAEAEARLGSDAAAAAERWLEAARLWGERLAHPDRADWALERAAAGDPSGLPAQEALLDRARASGDPARLAAQLARTAAAVAPIDPVRAGALAFEQGGVLDRALGARVEAVEAYRRALQYDPGCLGALEVLAEAFSESGRWSDLVQVFDTQAARAGDPAVTAGLFTQAARVLRGRLGRSDRAEGYLKRALEADPDYAPALEDLAPLLEARGAWGELADLFSRLAERTGDARRRGAFRYRRGVILEEHLGDPAGAEAEYRSAAEDPSAPEERLARWGRALETLGRWSEAAEVLLRQSARAGTPAEGVRLALEAALHWAERSGRPDLAARAYRRAHEIDPEAADPIEGLYRLAIEGGDWREALAWGGRLVDRLTESSDRAGLLVELARIEDEEAGHPLEARNFYRRAIEEDPSSIESAEWLSRRAVAEGRWEEAARVAQAALERIPEEERPLQGVVLALRLAWVLRRLGRSDEAKEAFQSAIEMDPQRSESWIALAELFLDEGRSDEASLVFQALLDQHPDPDAAAGALFRLAQILEGQGDSEEALDRVTAALALRPDLELAREWRVALLDRLGRAGEALEDLRELARGADPEADPDEAQKRLLALGRAEARTGLFEEAAGHLGAVFERDPSHRGVAETLREVLLPLERWGELVRLNKVLASGAPPPQARDLHLEAARWAEERIRDTDEAVLNYLQVLEADPECREALEALARIFRERGDRESMVDILSRLARLEPDPGRAARLHADLGRIYEAELGDPELARVHYGEAFARDPHDREIAEGYARALEGLEEWRALIPPLQALARHLDPKDAALQSAHHARLGEAYARAGMVEAAVESFEHALELKPEVWELQLKIAELYRRSPRRWAQSLEAYERILAREPRRLEAYEGIAEAHHAQGHVSEARAAYTALHLLAPGHAAADAYLKAHPPQGEWIRARTLQEIEGRELLLAPEERNALGLLLKAEVEGFLQWVPALSADAPPRGLVPVRLERHPGLKRLWDELIDFFVPGSLELCLDEQGQVERSRFYLNPPTLVFGTRFLRSLAELEARFVLGSAVTHVREGHALLARLGGEEWKIALEMARAALSEGEPALSLNRRQRRHFRSLQERAAQILPGLRDPAAEIRRFRREPWLKAFALTGDRGGYLACGDVEAGISAVVKEHSRGVSFEAELRRDGFLKFLERHPDPVVEGEGFALLRFSISSDLAQLRGRLQGEAHPPGA